MGRTKGGKGGLAGDRRMGGKQERHTRTLLLRVIRLAHRASASHERTSRKKKGVLCTCSKKVTTVVSRSGTPPPLKKKIALCFVSGSTVGGKGEEEVGCDALTNTARTHVDVFTLHLLFSVRRLGVVAVRVRGHPSRRH